MIDFKVFKGPKGYSVGLYDGGQAHIVAEGITTKRAADRAVSVLRKKYAALHSDTRAVLLTAILRACGLSFRDRAG